MPNHVNMGAFGSFTSGASLHQETATDRRGRLIAFVLNTEAPTVEIWNARSWTLVIRFPVCYSFGGRRIAMSQDGRNLATADYHAGIAVYDVKSGNAIWKLVKQRTCQHLAFSRNGKILRACFDTKPMATLRCSDGAEVLRSYDIRFTMDSPYSAHRIECGSSILLYRSSHLINEIKLETFDDAAFSSRNLLVSRLGMYSTQGPRVSCYDLQNGEHQWTTTSPAAGNFGTLGYCETSKCFLAVQGRGDNDASKLGAQLFSFESKSGRAQSLAHGLGWDFHTVVCSRGSKLVLGNGLVLSTRTGKPLRRLNIGG